MSWIFIGRTDAEAETPILVVATWWEELTHLQRPWCWRRLKVGGKGDNRGWDGWMASPTEWTWVWASSRSWWWTGKPGVLHSIGLQRVGQDLMTEQGFSHSSVGKESACNAGDPGSIPGSGRSPGEGNGNPLQHSCLENTMDRGAWRATVYGVAKSQTWLSD